MESESIPLVEIKTRSSMAKAKHLSSPLLLAVRSKIIFHGSLDRYFSYSFLPYLHNFLAILRFLSN